MNLFRLSLLFGLFAALSCPAARAAAPQTMNFQVLRDGDAVGSNVIRFEESGERLRVTIDTNIVVKIALIPVYRFEHHGQETWQNGRLTSLQSQTNDDGTRHQLQASADGMGLAITADGKHSAMPATALPASLWNPGIVHQKELLNTLDGSDMSIHVADLGSENVLVRGRMRAARHYAVTGDLERELWYDDQGDLVRVRFKAQDDSKIEYVLN